MRGNGRQKPYKNMQEGNPHIGELIKEVVARKGIRTTWFAEQLGCHRNNVYLIYSRPWIDTETLMKISWILEHNFFEDLSKWYEKE